VVLITALPGLFFCCAIVVFDITNMIAKRIKDFNIGFISDYL
jgi:hypothetical protein